MKHHCGHPQFLNLKLCFPEWCPSLLPCTISEAPREENRSQETATRCRMAAYSDQRVPELTFSLLGIFNDIMDTLQFFKE
jgi:hypothetical protein